MNCPNCKKTMAQIGYRDPGGYKVLSYSELEPNKWNSCGMACPRCQIVSVNYGFDVIKIVEND